MNCAIAVYTSGSISAKRDAMDHGLGDLLANRSCSNLVIFCASLGHWKNM